MHEHRTRTDRPMLAFIALALPFLAVCANATHPKSISTCSPQSDVDFCAALAKTCGQVSSADNCGQPRTVTSCGSCTAPETCGGGGIDNICGSRPGVTVHLERNFQTSATYASFGLPLPEGRVTDASSVRVLPHGSAVPIPGVHIGVLLSDYDTAGVASGVRALLIQIPVTAIASPAEIDVIWEGTGDPPPTDTLAFEKTKAPSPESVDTAERTIVKNGSTCALVETSKATKTLFTGSEPAYLATFPDGYLASTGIIGRQTPQSQIAGNADLAGVKYLSDAVTPFALSAMYAETYRLNPDPESVLDPVQAFEGWLYDRCTTFLSIYAHTGDARFLREAYRNCSYYASKINDAGIFTGKPDPDAKYSHLRGLYAYYALTGDEVAKTAGSAIATMWLNDTMIVQPYSQGHARGPDKLWTERLLGASMEGLYYGYRLLGDPQYLKVFQQMLDTAYTHITTSDQATLNQINRQDGSSQYPGFPPQNCFIHNATQAGEGEGTQPWCSGWMTELVVDVLLAYQHQTNDARIDQIFVRLTRFLRDVGSCYFIGDPLGDTFLSPKRCYDASAGVDARKLVPLYGAGLLADGTRFSRGEYDDYEHCSDATALTSAALRSLKRLKLYDAPGPKPFSSEGESFLQLFHEFSNCAQSTFTSWTRTSRDPAHFTSADLCDGASDPAAFITKNKIGYPSYPSTPQRKLSWWFNMSLLQFELLKDAAIKVPALHPGVVKPAGVTCP